MMVEEGRETRKLRSLLFTEIIPRVRHVKHGSGGGKGVLARDINPVIKFQGPRLLATTLEGSAPPSLDQSFTREPQPMGKWQANILMLLRT